MGGKMKFEMIKPEDKKYYNEIFYILLKYKKFLKNPNKKTISIMTSYLIKILFCIFFILYCLFFYFVFNSLFFIFFAGYFLFAGLLNTILFFRTKKQINSILSHDNKRTITLDDKKVEYMDINKSYRDPWSSIKYVLLNKYSIVFLPISKESALIALPIEKKNDVIKLLKEYGLENLIKGEYNEEK